MTEPDAAGLTALTAAAQARFAEKEFAAAREAFATLVRASPQNAHFADRHAHCHSALGEWQAARAAWSRAIECHGPSTARVNALARACIELRDYQTATRLLDANRGRIVPNANFYVFATLAAVGVGNIAAAAAHAMDAAQAESTEKVGATDTLIGMLQRLAADNHAADVLALFDHLLLSWQHNARFLQAGIAVATTLRAWNAKKRFAKALITLRPEILDFQVHLLHALINAGRHAEWQALLTTLNERLVTGPDVRDPRSALERWGAAFGRAWGG
jgi:tetratricopeptide (TPR) repeat protein